MGKGGIRDGAGRKPRTDVKATNRTVRFTDHEWDKVKDKAVSANKTVSDYIRAKVLAEDIHYRRLTIGLYLRRKKHFRV